MSKKINFGFIALLLLGLNLTSLSTAVAQGRDMPDRNSHANRAYTLKRSAHPSVGQVVRVLPSARQAIRIGAANYEYANGNFYRPSPQGGYVVVKAPLNARVRSLPPGAVTFWIGPRRYHYLNFTYYLWDEDRREYVVVEEPEGAETQMASASEETGELFVYPSAGQTEEQRDRDMYECYLWASEQTGFDPASGSSDSELLSNYRRANSACLEGRGYTVQ